MTRNKNKKMRTTGNTKGKIKMEGGKVLRGAKKKQREKWEKRK